MRILIAEDNASIAKAVADCLGDAGHEVVGPASTATEALAFCESLLPELALLDIDLRDGSNGVNVARALFNRGRVLSIFASGQTMEARQARGFALGLIRKPYGVDTVLRSVEVAREVKSGRTPRHVPAGLELFSAAN